MIEFFNNNTNSLRKGWHGKVYYIFTQNPPNYFHYFQSIKNSGNGGSLDFLKGTVTFAQITHL